MAFLASTFPILPGKKEQWRRFIAEIAGPRREDFNASRQRAGVRERTFLQETPHGDMVIVVLEGDDPARAFGQMMSQQDAFTQWFLSQVQELHGVDLSQTPTGPPPEMVLDSGQSG